MMIFVTDSIGKEHVVRLLTFQPGSILKDVPGSTALYSEVGIFAAKVDIILKVHVAAKPDIPSWVVLI